MPATTIENDFAEKAAKESAKIERAAMRSARRISSRLRAGVMREIRSGQKFELNALFVRLLLPLITAAQMASHLAGFRRSQLLFKKQGLKLSQSLALAAALPQSELNDALKVLERSTGLDLDALQAQYNTTALKVINNVADSTELELRKEVTRLVTEGAHVNEAIDALGKKFTDLGLSPQKDYQLEAIFRTQIQIAYSAGRWEAEQDPDIQEILWGYKYVTTGDDRVREEHAALEGVTLPKDDAFWRRFYPPNGWNCRCQAIPIFEERPPVTPPATLDDGITPVAPDKGFDLNFGEALGANKPKPPEDDAAAAKRFAKAVDKQTKIDDAAKVQKTEKEKRIDSLSEEIDGVRQELSPAMHALEQVEKSAQEELNKLKQIEQTTNDEIAKFLVRSKAIIADPSLTHEEKVAALEVERPQRVALYAKFGELRAAAHEVEAKARRECFNVISDGGKGASLSMNTNGTTFGRWATSDGRILESSRVDSTRLSENIVGTLQELKGVIGSSVLGDKILTEFYQTTDSRSFARDGKVYMNENAPRTTIAHELGHTIETRAGLSEKIQTFIERRCGDEKPTHLATKFPENGFKDNEYGLGDKWLAVAHAIIPDNESAGYYIGKTYSDRQTEVLSMGLEMLYKNPIKFSQLDPDYFAFVVGCLRGKIDETSTPNG